jgi:hypothetical protein
MLILEQTILTTLHIALKKGLLDLEIFLKYNVNPNIVKCENVYTPLHLVTMNDVAPKSEEIISTLLIEGANVDLKQINIDTFGKTAFFYFYEFQYDLLHSQTHTYNFHRIYYIFINHKR